MKNKFLSKKAAKYYALSGTAGIIVAPVLIVTVILLPIYSCAGNSSLSTQTNQGTCPALQRATIFLPIMWALVFLVLGICAFGVALLIYWDRQGRKKR